MNKRAAHITLDRLTGMTYVDLGEKWGISDARAHQIVRATLSEAEGRHGVKHPVSKATFGAWVTRMEARQRHLVAYDSPEMFFWNEVVEQEEQDRRAKRHLEDPMTATVAEIRLSDLK